MWVRRLLSSHPLSELMRLLSSLFLLLFVAGCSSGSMTADDAPNRIAIDTAGLSADATIVENAMAQPQLSTLVSALRQADLVGALNGDGPYTVFAPIDPAFARADVSEMSAEELAATLKYHVVEGDLSAASLTEGTILQTLAPGENLTVTIDESDGSIQVDDADILYADIEASNGRIHLINLVLDPLAQGVTSVD